jgi:peptidoglycan/LPS O-acetylase OafA/YrhL
LIQKQQFVTPPANAFDDIRTYKPFVDGLRAIAILTVVGAHVGMPGFSGGYVGVDIFFVISGYLIINQIVADIGKGRFSLLDFGARRAYRILPAFLLVMLAVLILVTTVFVQPEYKDFAQSFFFSGLMVVNHHFLAHQGYFDMAAFSKPLLHMWSLAVEEQFYLVAPLTLLGITAITARLTLDQARRAWRAAALGLAITSFVACVAFTYPAGRSNISFYVMPMRGWEFILGAIAPSLGLTLRHRPAWVAGATAAIGASAVALAFVLFDEHTLFPSYRAALPAVGAMLIIAAGLARPRNAVAVMLATAPMVGIGLVSYAWYLWHWPFISFVRTMNFGGRDLTKEVGAAALALGLAVLTYWFVELPIRNWRRRGIIRPARVAVIGPALCILVAGSGYLWSMSVAPRMLPSIAGLEQIEFPRHDGPPPSRRGLLLGDSHANVIHRPLREYARRSDAQLAVTARAGCAPLFKTAVTDHRGRPFEFCEPFFQKIDFGDADFVIIVARWNFYLNLPPSDPFYHSFILVDSEGRQSNPYDVLAKGLAATIAQSKRSGVRRVLIMGPLPEFPAHPPYCLMRLIRVGIDGCTISRRVVEARRARTMDTIHRIAADFEGVRLIDPIDLFCSAETCRPHRDTTLYFKDTNHLSPAGIALLYQKHEGDFRWAFAGDRGVDGQPSPAAFAR